MSQQHSSKNRDDFLWISLTSKKFIHRFNTTDGGEKERESSQTPGLDLHGYADSQETEEREGKKKREKRQNTLAVCGCLDFDERISLVEILADTSVFFRSVPRVHHWLAAFDEEFRDVDDEYRLSEGPSTCSMVNWYADEVY